MHKEPILKDVHAWTEFLHNGSEEAFGVIYRQYWSSLYSAAYNYTRSRETAQEIVQEVFVKLWLRRKQLQVTTEAKAYLLGATRNKVYDHFDRLAVEQKHAAFLARHTPVSAHETDQQLAYAELSELVERQINALPSKTRDVFRLSRMEGLSIAEIARQLRISSKGVEYHLSKALKHLRHHLTELLMLLLLIK